LVSSLDVAGFDNLDEKYKVSKSHMVINSFIDPVTKKTLVKDNNGDLFCEKRKYKCYAGIYDFITENTEIWQEREFHEKIYKNEKQRIVTEEEIKNDWNNDIYPFYKTYLESMGELKNKKILCVGNGDKIKELYFLTQGAKVVITDLSLEAMKKIKNDFFNSLIYEKYKDNIEFHSVDALNMPFADNEFDIIYGASFVHHIQDNINQFFSEVYRCLKTGGICRFIDTAYSPTWELIKKILYPIKVYSYKKQPRSPEDIKAKPFTNEWIFKIKNIFGFRELLWQREWFFLSIFTRHFGKLVNWNPDKIKKVRPVYLKLKLIDQKLSKTKWMQNNAINLIAL
jgi:ubiquinone/menaquinone biosynthesis C-methylase UbiE